METVKFTPMPDSDEAINDELEKLARKLSPDGNGQFIFLCAKAPGTMKITVCSNVQPTVAVGICEAMLEMLGDMAPVADQVLEMVQGEMELIEEEDLPSYHQVKH